MKNATMSLALLLSIMSVQAQLKRTEVTNKNSWLKLGVITGLPAGKATNYSSFVAGIDLKAQHLLTRYFGIGVTGGYNQLFAKENTSGNGILPIGGIVRVYPGKEGVYLGVDGGVAVVTGKTNNKSGLYTRPQIGYHNYSWNLFVFYNHVFRSDANGGKIQYGGIGCAYNLRFK